MPISLDGFAHLPVRIFVFGRLEHQAVAPFEVDAEIPITADGEWAIEPYNHGDGNHRDAAIADKSKFVA